MGCAASRQAVVVVSNSRLATVDDSVHVMIEHSKRICLQKGQAVHGYIPRAPHPLLLANIQAQEEDDGGADERTLEGSIYTAATA